MRYRLLSRREFTKIFLKISAVACLPGCAAETSDGDVDSNQPDTPQGADSFETEKPNGAYSEGIWP